MNDVFQQLKKPKIEWPCKKYEKLVQVNDSLIFSDQYCVLIDFSVLMKLISHFLVKNPHWMGII